MDAHPSDQHPCLKRPCCVRASLAGFAATAAMTVFIYICPSIGIPLHDVAAALGAIFYGTQPEIGTAPWWGGLLFHFVNGTFIFPLIYDVTMFNCLRGAPWLKGMCFGAILWVLALSIVVPLLGGGFWFSDEAHPVLMGLGSLLAHLIYGAILGAVAGEGVVEWIPREQEKPYEHRVKH